MAGEILPSIMNRQRKHVLDYLLLFLPVVFLLCFFYIPILTVLKNAFFQNSHFSYQLFVKLLNDPYELHVILFTIKQAFLSLLVTFFLSLPLCYLLSKFQFPGKDLIKSLYMVPFVLPGIIVSLGFILFLGNEGYCNRFLALFGLHFQVLYSLKAILLAHAFYNIPVFVKIVSDTWERINPHYYQVAKTLGSHGFHLFRKVTIPFLLPAILNASILVFIYCFMSFGIVLVLGNIRFATIEVNIYMLVKNLLQTDLGMALGFIQIILSSLFLFFSIHTQKKHEQFYATVLLDSPYTYTRLFSLSSKKEFVLRACLIVYLFSLLLLFLGPIMSIITYVIINAHTFKELLLSLFSLSTDPIIGSSRWQAIINSFSLAFCVALFTTALNLIYNLALKKYKQYSFFALIALLPMGVSSVTFSLGYLYLGNSLTISNWILLLSAHTIIAFPLSFQIMNQAFQHLNNSEIIAAKCLGANRSQLLWRIIIPHLIPGLLIAITFSFAISMGEFGATSMLQQNFVTIPLAIYRYISAYQFMHATSMGVLLIFVSCFSFYLSEKLRNRLIVKGNN